MNIQRLGAALAASLVFALPFLARPALARDAVPGVSESEIRIGMVNAQSGPAAGLGRGTRQGAEAVFKEVNEAGGIFGRRISLRVADDAYEPERTVAETLRLAQEDNVFSFIGFVGTPTTNSVLPLIKELEIPVLGIVSGAQSMRVPASRQIFNLRASYDNETQALIEKLFEGGVRSVGIVYQFDGFGLSVLAGTERALKARGTSVVASGSFTRNTVAIKGALAAMLESRPDVVVLAGTYEPVAAFIKAARAAGLRSQFATVSFVGTNHLMALLHEEGEGLLISQVVPFPEDLSIASVRECTLLLEKYEKVALDFTNFESCIGARVMVDALKAAGPELTRTAFTDALANALRHEEVGAHVAFTARSNQVFNRVYLTQVHKGVINKVN